MQRGQECPRSRGPAGSTRRVSGRDDLRWLDWQPLLVAAGIAFACVSAYGDPERSVRLRPGGKRPHHYPEFGEGVLGRPEPLHGPGMRGLQSGSRTASPRCSSPRWGASADSRVSTWPGGWWLWFWYPSRGRSRARTSSTSQCSWRLRRCSSRSSAPRLTVAGEQQSADHGSSLPLSRPTEPAPGAAVGGFLSTARFPNILPILGETGSFPRRRYLSFVTALAVFGGVTALTFVVWGQDSRHLRAKRLTRIWDGLEEQGLVKLGYSEIRLCNHRALVRLAQNALAAYIAVHELDERLGLSGLCD